MEPAALRLAAEVELPAPAGATRWLRIVGDDQRGYLLSGDLELWPAPAVEEFWFPTIEEAIAAAERVGIPRAAWRQDPSPAATITRRARPKR